jgi:DNA-binding transcriptional LysR family regulator
MLDLADVRIFVQAVDAGGLSAAARLRSMPKSSISRALVRLEARLGVVLLERSTRGMRVTDAGLLFLPHARRLLDSAEEAQAAVDGLIDQPQGILRVNAALTFALGVIAPMLPSFLDSYPDVSVVLDTDNHVIDLARGDADVAIRIGPLIDSGLMVRRLGDIELWPCASPAYLALHGTPVSVPDLNRHRLINRRGVGAAWQFRTASGDEEHCHVPPGIAVSEPAVLQEVLLGGAGIGRLPDFLARPHVQSGRLVRLLPAWRGEHVEANALYARNRTVSAKVRLFIDALQEHVRTEASNIAIDGCSK